VGQYCLKNIDLSTAAQELDFLNLMGYDFTGPWTELSGHHSQLFTPQGGHPSLKKSCSGGVEYVLSQGFPSHKLVLGIPAYARRFRGATGPGQTFQGGDEIEYKDISQEWIEKAQVDRVLGAAYYIDGDSFLSFDIPETVRVKAHFAKDLSLAGLFYWTGVGDAKGSSSLVREGFQALLDISHIEGINSSK
jgi:chitinase